MRLFDFVSSSFSSIKSVVKNVVSGAQSWVMGKVKSSLASTVDTIAESAVNATERKIKSSIETIANQLGVKSKEMVTTAQAAVEQGILESNQKADEVLERFNGLMRQFRTSLDQKRAQQLEQEEQAEQHDSFINLDDGERLYQSLNDLGQTFQEGKIKLEAFARQGKSTIENAKPKIEQIIGNAFVESIINPILGFFKELVGSLIKSVIQDLCDGLSKVESQPAAEEEHLESAPSFKI
jgi:phage-related protein